MGGICTTEDLGTLGELPLQHQLLGLQLLVHLGHLT